LRRMGRAARAILRSRGRGRFHRMKTTKKKRVAREKGHGSRKDWLYVRKRQVLKGAEDWVGKGQAAKGHHHKEKSELVSRDDRPKKSEGFKGRDKTNGVQERQAEGT